MVGDFKRRFPSLRSRLLSWQDVTVRLANDSDWPQWEALFREYRISQSPGTTGTTGTTRGFVWSIFTLKRNLRWFWCEKIWRSHRPYWTSMRIGFFLSANFRPDLCSKDSGRVTALHAWQDCNWRSCVAGFDAVVAQTKEPVLLTCKKTVEKRDHWILSARSAMPGLGAVCWRAPPIFEAWLERVEFDDGLKGKICHQLCWDFYGFLVDLLQELG